MTLISLRTDVRFDHGPCVDAALAFAAVLLACDAFIPASEEVCGSLRVDARTVHGVHHTLTVWTSKADMLAFLHSPVHRRAMMAFPSIATGRIFGYETDDMPTWPEARSLWQVHGRVVG